MGEATWSIPELSQREKVLVCIAAAVCMRDIELPLEMHVQMAAANQVPMDDVRETILRGGSRRSAVGAEEIQGALQKS